MSIVTNRVITENIDASRKKFFENGHNYSHS